MIKDLFSIPFLENDLNLNLDGLVKFSLDKKIEDKQGRSLSNLGGWQSNDLKNTDNHMDISMLKQYILNNVKDLQKKYSIREEAIPVIDNLWININEKGNYNLKHIHPHCFFSGVFYIQCDEKLPSKLVFFHPAYDIMQYDWKDSLYNKYVENNSHIWKIIPKSNSLILFPSWLQHSVEPNPSAKTRISISFNISLYLIWLIQK